MRESQAAHVAPVATRLSRRLLSPPPALRPATSGRAGRRLPREGSRGEAGLPNTRRCRRRVSPGPTLRPAGCRERLNRRTNAAVAPLGAAQRVGMRLRSRCPRARSRSLGRCAARGHQNPGSTARRSGLGTPPRTAQQAAGIEPAVAVVPSLCVAVLRHIGVRRERTTPPLRLNRLVNEAFASAPSPPGPQGQRLAEPRGQRHASEGSDADTAHRNHSLTNGTEGCAASKPPLS
jgi:hypothetical protein